jgi:hypothetical protein
VITTDLVEWIERCPGMSPLEMDRAAKWALKGFNWSKHKIIIVPVHAPGHWFLLVIII